MHQTCMNDCLSGSAVIGSAVIDHLVYIYIYIYIYYAYTYIGTRIWALAEITSPTCAWTHPVGHTQKVVTKIKTCRSGPWTGSPSGAHALGIWGWTVHFCKLSKRLKRNYWHAQNSVKYNCGPVWFRTCLMVDHLFCYALRLFHPF